LKYDDARHYVKKKRGKSPVFFYFVNNDGAQTLARFVVYAIVFSFSARHRCLFNPNDAVGAMFFILM